MRKEGYGKLVQFGKESNPALFNNPERMRTELEKLDKDLNIMSDPIAKSITIQTRNILAFALGEELMDEEPTIKEIERRYER